MLVNTALPCLLASFCFYFSGKPYVEFKEQFNKDMKQAEELAEEIGAESCDLQNQSSIAAAQLIRLQRVKLVKASVVLPYDQMGAFNMIVDMQGPTGHTSIQQHEVRNVSFACDFRQN